MPTIPTGQMERELRKLYLQWVSGLSVDSKNISGKISSFQRRSEDLIERMGGQVARLGALGDFPAPRRLELSPYAGKTYDAMQQAAIQAGILTGISSKEAAQAMFRAGMDKSYRRVERLARTETVSAYWKNAWDSVADLPLLVMVWGAEDGPRTCAWCKERDGLVMDSSSLRDHPNGRCTPIPMLRSAVEYKGSISADGQIYQDDRWEGTTKRSAISNKTPATLKDNSSGHTTFMDESATAKDSLSLWKRLISEEDSITGLGSARQASVYRQTGTMNNLPRKISSSEYDDLVSGGAVQMYRGIAPVEGRSASDLVQQFLEGDHFAGTGIYGGGSYFSPAKGLAENYAGSSGKVLSVALRKDARIIDYQTAFDRAGEAYDRLKAAGATMDELQYLGDPGVWAAAHGYDAIAVTVVPGLDIPSNYQYIILNRSALVYKEG